MKTAIILCLTILAGAEPAPRKAFGSALKTDVALKGIGGVYELKDGRLLVSDPETPAVYMLDPATGKTKRLGAVGAGPGRYARPGGFYRGAGDTILMIDRGQTRALVITSSGVLVDSRSIAERGTTSSSPGADLQRLDRHGLVYTFKRTFGDSPSDSNLVIRMNAATQKQDTVAHLLKAAQKTIQLGDHMTNSRTVVGSPSDGWGVAGDGRLAIVRASPYRVEWHAPSGAVTKGPVIQYDVLPMTEADKKEWADRGDRTSGGVGVGQAGGAASSSDLPTTFAPTKPAFDSRFVTVAPDNRVWVKRSAVANATTAVYDVFDSAGERVDRIALPASAVIVGFGTGSVFTTDEKVHTITRYKL